MSSRPRVIFMGTPAFAVPTLTELIEEGYAIAGVYTQPPRPAHRGQKETKSPIHVLAEKHGLPVFTPINFKSEEAKAQFKRLNADVAVVAAYGLLLPPAILEAPKHGCINIHPSLLPRWRGAAPIQRTLMAGDTDTAVCIMKMDEGLDTGDVLLKENVKIPYSMNASDLHDHLSLIGADLTLQALQALQDESWNPKPQSGEGVTYAKKITKDEARIDWTKPAQEILWKIRGLAPSPGAHGLYQETPIKILAAELVDNRNASAAPGQILDEHFTIATGNGALRPTWVLRPGKRAMSTEEMLRGQPVIPGSKLT